MLLTYFLNDFAMVPVAPIINGITLVFTFHMRCISIVRSLYFKLLLLLLQLYCHSMAVVLTLVQTKHIRINVHKRNNTRNTVKQYKARWIQVHILPKHPHITKSKILYDGHLHHRHFCSVFLLTSIPFPFRLHASLRW
jgi:hypothetical protein